MKAVAYYPVFALGLFSILIAASQGFIARPKLKCWGTPADIVFVLDSSTSIWGPDFKKQLEFVKYMIDHLDIGMGPDQVRIGVETFSTIPQVRIDLADSMDKTILKKRIEQIPQVRGNTNIGDALKQLLSTMFKPEYGSRTNARHMAILITDGTSQDERATQKAAKICRDANIQLFVIGIGRNVDVPELEGIASRPHSRFLFRTPTYDALNQIREDIIQQTCEAVEHTKPVQTTLSTPTKIPSDMKACKNKTADIFFLLDSSSSIKVEEFEKEINVIENIVAQFDISPTKTRVGVSVFGHEYYQMLSFQDGASKAEALKEIRNIKYVGGGTETGRALNYVRNEVFNKALIRPGADRLLIVFTDGRSGNYAQTSAEAKLLQESGVKIFAVGIGPYVDETELKDIASEPSHEFTHTFDTFDILLEQSGLLTHKACTVDVEKPLTDQNECNATQRTDVIFMVSNNHFGQTKTNRILKASAEVISTVGSYGAFSFGSIFDNCLPEQDKPIGSIADESQLVSFKYGSIASLVHKLRTETFSSGSWEVSQVGLLFLDNTIDLNDPKIQKEVKHALFQNIKLYIVIIGDGVNEQLVGTFVPSEERIIKISSYDNLISYLPSQFTKTLCKRADRNSTNKPQIS